MIRKNDITEGIYIKDGFTISSAGIAIRSNNSIVTPGTGTMSIDFTFDEITTRYKVADTHTQLTVGEFVKISSQNTGSNRSIEVHKDDIKISGLGQGFVFAGPGGSLYTTMTASAAPAGPAGPQGPTGPSITGPTGPAGATGPSIVSTDFGNIAELGSDGYIYVPSIPATQSYDDGSDSVKSVYVATTTVLTRTPTYDNGVSGVGATLTGSSNGTLGTIDGIVMDNSRLGERVLVKNQASTLQNGIYVLTTVGSATQSYVLTRSTDSDETDEFDSQVVTPVFGTTNKGRLYGQTTNQPTVGTSSIVYTQTNSVYISQQTSGTQSNYQIPIYTGTARQLTKGTAKFKYDYLTNRITINGDSLLFPATNSVGSLTNDGTGVLSWTSSTSGGSVAIDVNQIPFGTGVGITSSNIFIINPSDGAINLGHSQYNIVGGFGSSIIAGAYHKIEDSNYSSVISGQFSRIYNGDNSDILGGNSNIIQDSYFSSIISGNLNIIDNSLRSVSLGGFTNFIGTSSNSTIIGGSTNSISGRHKILDSTIIGGNSNNIIGVYGFDSTETHNVVIIGGESNTIKSNYANDTPDNSVIVGGKSNLIFSNPTGGGGDGSYISTIVGGRDNEIKAGIDSSIIGGRNNYISDYNGGISSGSNNAVVSGFNNSSRFNAASIMIGGQSNTMYESNYSAIIGGTGLSLSNEINMVFVPQLKINNVNSSTASNPKVLIWDGKDVKYENASTILAGSVSTSTPIDLDQIAFGTGIGITSSVFMTFDSYNQNSILGSYLSSINGSTFKSALVGGTNNIIDSSNAGVILGGVGNNLNSSFAGVIGGYYNGMNGSAYGSFIIGRNNVMFNASSSSILGGQYNTISGNNSTSVISGGKNNIIATASSSSIISSDVSTIVNGSRSIIVGGASSSISRIGGFSAVDSSIIGGFNNIIFGLHGYGGSDRSSIIGGYSNKISNSGRSSIIGGYLNKINEYGTANSLIGGGGRNLIGTASFGGFIGGSKQSTIIGRDNSVILGSSGKTLSSAITSKNETTLVTNFIIAGSMSTINGMTYSEGFNGTVNTTIPKTFTIVNGLIVNVV